MSYDPHVVDEIRRIWRRRGLPGRYLTGAYDTGIVESGLRDLPGGDADSYGFRQQRLSGYGRQPLRRQINNLFNEFQQFDKGQPLGQLIADVQRPAAQYRGRYSDPDILRRARALAGGGGGGGGVTLSALMTPIQSALASPGASPANPISAIASMQQPQGDNPYNEIMQRGWNLLAQLWEQKHGGTVPSVMGGGGMPVSAGLQGDTQLSGSRLSRIMQRANAVDKAQLPYSWGGGHDRKHAPLKGDVVPVDCSGAVSEILGINPRVASQFKGWGKAGDGGDKGVTIYAKDTHVLMKINGRFFGTSGSNPGGGAGWIDASQISPSYLKGFQVRHK